MIPNVSVQLTDSKPTLHGVTVCDSDHPSLKLSFGTDTMHFQWERRGDSNTPSSRLDCTVDYSIGYTGSDPWYEGHVNLPEQICGEKLDIRIHVHSSFEQLDFHDGDKKMSLKREMKDGVDHCGHCDCGDCHYDCSSFGELTSVGPQHRRRRGGPTPAPKDCPCGTESPLDTVTRRRQFKSARVEPSFSV